MIGTEAQGKSSGREPAFAGFGQAAFDFLEELATRQDREWFEAHKVVYEREVRGPMTALAADLSDELSRRGLRLRGDPLRSVFRIHRDIRFAKDKRPYKTHVGATLSRDGGKLSPGLLYIHIDPRGCFTAGGFYRPEPEVLRAIREAIASDGVGLRAVLSGLAQEGLAFEPDEDALKRPPRGFETVTEPDLRNLLCRRSFVVRRALTQEAVGLPSLIQDLATFAQAIDPLLNFGWSALDV